MEQGGTRRDGALQAGKRREVLDGLRTKEEEYGAAIERDGTLNE